MRNVDSLNPSSVDSMARASSSTVLKDALEPGKTADFTVVVKSGAREGRYISYWRLKTPDGTPFGHKLWIDIIVKDTGIQLPIRAVPALESKQATVSDEDEEQKGSTMIFPTLDKESPVSSIHDVAGAAAPEAPSVQSEEHDLLDDVESLELEEESDDGFLTDEEYDVLDASDEDFLEAQSVVNSK
jgi:next to BRCA1 gene 1 protein